MKVVVTRKIPRLGIDMLENAGFEVVGNDSERLLTKEQMKDFVKGADAILCLLLDKIDEEVMAGMLDGRVSVCKTDFRRVQLPHQPL